MKRIVLVLSVFAVMVVGMSSCIIVPEGGGYHHYHHYHHHWHDHDRW